MSAVDSENPRFDVRTRRLVRQCLRVCRYHDDQAEVDYTLNSGFSIPLVAFAHRPHDARSSCVAFLGETRTPRQDVSKLHELGVPVAFLTGTNSWDMWSLRSDGPRREQSVPLGQIETFFENNKERFAPGSVFRAKTWARAVEARQLDFVDTGLLPIVEKEAGDRLRQLFEDMVARTMEARQMSPGELTDAEAHWVMKANFWLLAGKLLRDKQVPKFVRLDLHDVQNVFDRVAEHYDAQRVRTDGRLTALREAAAVASDFSSLRSISTETLGALYEEALLSDRTRKLLSVHRTPTYLVDYILAKLSRWIENDIGIENCQVFEPACGHSPFLVGAVRFMSDLLPSNIGSDRIARRQFLRKHIRGCDRDAFSLEIARLCLTLADIPNPNGWLLDDVTDMFAGDYLDNRIAASSVILVNPPFEKRAITTEERREGDLRFQRNGQAAEVLRRILRSSRPGTAFGIIVPQTILDGNWFVRLRRRLLEECDVSEITSFPDKVLQFADVESGIILARKRSPTAPRSSHYCFRRVHENGMADFIANYRASQEVRASPVERLATTDTRLSIPPLAGLWEIKSDSLLFSNIAVIAHGLFYRSSADPNYPAGEVTISNVKRTGLVEGYAYATGRWYTHDSPKTVWLNLRRETISSLAEGTTTGRPQVLMTKARASRSQWRQKAFIDYVGRPFVHRFIVFRPKEGVSVELLWALCNSPYANAYTYSNSQKRDIKSSLLGSTPIPDIRNRDLGEVETSVRAYLTAAQEFVKRQEMLSSGPKRGVKTRNSRFVQTKEQLVFNGIEVDETQALGRILTLLL